MFCHSEFRNCVIKKEVDVLGLPVPSSPYGLCGGEVTFEEDVLLFCGTLQGKGEVCVCV